LYGANRGKHSFLMIFIFQARPQIFFLEVNSSSIQVTAFLYFAFPNKVHNSFFNLYLILKKIAIQAPAFFAFPFVFTSYGLPFTLGSLVVEVCSMPVNVVNLFY